MRIGDIAAILVAAVIGLPLVYIFAQAVSDGHVRAQEAPVRSVLGDELFESLMEGDRPPQHYLLGRRGDRLRAPDFSLPDRHGRTWTLSDHRGKVVVLNFWTITCQPCITEMPTLDTLAKFAVEDWGDVEVVAVTTDSSWDVVAPVLPEQPAITILFDPRKEVVTGRYGTQLYPETWIIDREGIIRFRYDGPLDWSKPLILDVIESFR